MFKDFEPTLIKLAKTYQIGNLEWQDIAQELRIWLWLKEKEQKKPIKNYNNWGYIVCRNKIIDLARFWGRQKRNKKYKVSLDELKEKGIDLEG